MRRLELRRVESHSRRAGHMAGHGKNVWLWVAIGLSMMLGVAGCELAGGPSAVREDLLASGLNYYSVAARHSSLAILVGLGAGVLISATIASVLRRPLLKTENYRNLFEDAPIGIYRSALDGRILAANTELLRLLGFDTLEELQDYDAAENGFRRNSARQALSEMLKERGQVKGFEYVLTRRDGSALHVSENARAIKDANAIALHYEGTVEDISARKETERAVLQSERDYRDLFEAAAEPILIIASEDHQILHANHTARELFGMTKEEPNSLFPKEIIDLIIQLESVRRTWPDRTEGNKRAVRVGRDGEEALLEPICRRINYKGKPAILATLHDVSQQERVADGLRSSQAMVKSVLDCLPQRVFCKDADGKYTVANKSFANWNGLGEEEIIGRTDFELYSKQVARKYATEDG